MEWRNGTDPTEIEHYLMLRNRLHFGQAQGTPFTESPLAEDFDWGATSESAEDVLTAHCKELLDECKAAKKLYSVNAELTMEEFAGKIKTWREATTTQSLTFLEELKYDICYLSRRSLFSFDNDAMSCYDRIIVALASLINRKHGQHRSIVAVHATIPPLRSFSSAWNRSRIRQFTLYLAFCILYIVCLSCKTGSWCYIHQSGWYHYMSLDHGRIC